MDYESEAHYMQPIELVANYSVAGDLATVIICGALFFLIKNTLFFESDRSFNKIKGAMIAVSVAAFSNVVFYHFCKLWPDGKAALIVSRDIYHGGLLLALYFTIIYVRGLLLVDDKCLRTVSTVTKVVFIVGTALDFLSPITHFGFYEKNGLWYDSTYIKPYTFVFIYSMVLIVSLMIIYRRRLIKTVCLSLMYTEGVSITVLLIENALESNTYTSFTFILPIISVLILIHSKPYDLTTGAMSASAFNSYAAHTYKKKGMIDIMVLKLELKNRNTVPDELGKILYSFWLGYVREAILFSFSDDTFVLTIKKKNTSEDNTEAIRKLIEEVFPQYYKVYNIPYKIFALYGVDFINTSTELQNIIDYLSETHRSNTVTLADEGLMKKLRTRKDVLKQLKDIAGKNDLDDPRVKVFCQPVKNLKNGSFDTAEALMRLELPEMGMIFPDIFIPLAEKYDLIHPLSMIILNKVCRYIKLLEEDGITISRISVNFTISELTADGFSDEVFKIIENNHISFSKIGVELTESQNYSDYLMVKERVQELKERGIKVYLDDFGTGYSNFDRILSLGLDVIKFDRSLLLMAGEDKNSLFSMRLFSEAFKEMGFNVLFEGIETNEQQEICASCNADYLQGYMFSKPVPIENYRDFL